MAENVLIIHEPRKNSGTGDYNKEREYKIEFGVFTAVSHLQNEYIFQPYNSPHGYAEVPTPHSLVVTI